MKLPRTTITKKQKRKAKQKKLSIFLIILGLSLIASSLFYFAFLEKEPLYLNPLSRNQTSKNYQIEKILSEKKISYISVVTSSDLDYIVKLNGESEVIIDSNKDIGEQLSSLQLIISQLTIEGKKFKSLDFRYQKPIIKF